MAATHTAAATLAGQAAAMPVATTLGAALGVPVDLLAWGMFGALVALAKSEPAQPPKQGIEKAVSVAITLAIGAGFGAVFSALASDIAVFVAQRFGVDIAGWQPGLLKPFSVVLGFGTVFLPELIRIGKSRLNALGGEKS